MPFSFCCFKREIRFLFFSFSVRLMCAKLTVTVDVTFLKTWFKEVFGCVCLCYFLCREFSTRCNVSFVSVAVLFTVPFFQNWELGDALLCTPSLTLTLVSLFQDTASCPTGRPLLAPPFCLYLWPVLLLPPKLASRFVESQNSGAARDLDYLSRSLVLFLYVCLFP